MIEQLKTIREALDAMRHGNAYAKAEDAYFQALTALTALTQLEALVGEQKPVGEVRWAADVPDTIKEVKFYGDTKPPVGTKLYTAAPAAQQYEAGDVASAAAQGFRDGVASVAQQPQKLEDIEQYRMRMAGICTAAIGYWKEGDPIHPDYDTPALRDVAKLYAKYAALYKAQQPQARPDFNDEWTGYLKDGETPFERFLRERKDMQSVLEMYQRVLEENERLKAQQPQAEPFGYVSQHTNGSWEFSPTAAGVYPDTAKSITAVYTKQQQAEAVPELCPSCRNGDLYACTCTFPKTKPEPEALPIGVVVAIDASDPETGPDAIVALHRDVALGAKLYDKPPSRSAEIAELKESLRISLENYESQRKAAGQARAAMYDIHYALKDAGWHPGRTDDKLADIIRAKGERMRELEADSGIKLTPEEVEALRLTMSSAVLFNRANNMGDVRPHQPDPEAVAEGLAQIIFEAINPGKVWTYQSTDVRNAYWQAGQAAKEFLK